MARRKRQVQRINATKSFESKVARTENNGTMNRQRACPRCGGGHNACVCGRNTPPQEPGCGCGRRK